MAQHYSNPRRENDPYALPDVETFYVPANSECWFDDNGEALPAGWYYWFCFPGCLPDSEPNGPFDSEDAAVDDARDGTDETQETE